MKYFTLILILSIYSCNSQKVKKKNITKTIWATKERAEYYDSIIDYDTKKSIDDFVKKNEGNFPEAETFKGIKQKN